MVVLKAKVVMVVAVVVVREVVVAVVVPEKVVAYGQDGTVGWLNVMVMLGL